MSKEQISEVLTKALNGRRDTDTSEDDASGSPVPVPQMEHADSGERTQLVMTQGIKPKIRRRSSILSSHHVPPPK